MADQETNSGEEGESPARPTPAEINRDMNHSRLSRMEKIAAGVDGRRSGEFDDVDGLKVIGRFQDGELDESPEAKERKALQEEAEAEAALREQAERAEREEDDGQDAARRLQAEGVEEPATRDVPRGTSAVEEGDEKTIDGVRYYATVVGNEMRWLTLKQLREQAGRAGLTERALQDAQEAVKRSTQLALAHREQPSEISQGDLEEVIASASMGDETAIKKLASVLTQATSTKTQVDVSRQISEQIATQRAVDSGERAQQDILSNASLAPVFRMRLSQLSQEAPDLMIVEAYRRIGDQIRKEFAPMLSQSSAPRTKEERKRTLVNVPAAAGRQRQQVDEEQEEPVGSVIDQMAKGRGRDRAVRQRRY